MSFTYPSISSMFKGQVPYPSGAAARQQIHQDGIHLAGERRTSAVPRGGHPAAEEQAPAAPGKQGSGNSWDVDTLRLAYVYTHIYIYIYT